MMNVQYLGTCRVQVSLKALADAGRINLLPGFYGFAHSAPEALQTLQLCDGTLAAPVEDRAALNLAHLEHARYSRGESLSSSFDGADIVFVEVSSLKTYQFKGYYTQVNRLSEHFGVPVPEVDRMLQSKDMASGQSSHPLKAVSFRKQDVAELAADMQAILQKLEGRRVVMLNSFIVDDERRPMFEARERIRDLLAELCERTGSFVHYDPSVALAAYSGGIKDYGHYDERFPAILAEQFMRLIDDATEEPSARAA